MPNSATTSLKLDADLKARVQQLAKARRRTSHWIMREAVEQYVGREEKREQFQQDALVAWNEYRAKGLHVTAEEADAWLAKLSSLLSTNPEEQSFYASPSISELAAMQKVEGARELSTLADGIPDDEDVDELIDGIYAART